MLHAFRSSLRTALFAGLLTLAGNAVATFHLFVVDQVYSNADGRIQFIVFQQSPPANDEHEWKGHELKSTHGGVTQTYAYTHDLPSNLTRNHRVLVATQAFADLGIVTPDYIIPNGFLATGSGLIACCDGYQFGYAALPVDGVSALDALHAVVPNLATNFAGATGSVSEAPPAAFDLDQHGLTGSWYEPATSGQGFEVEIFSDFIAPGKAFTQVSWFTYDTVAGAADRQRWYTLSGTVERGKPTAALSIYLNTGGNFNAAPVTTGQAVGTATLGFDTCTSGQLAYAFTDGSARTGTIPLIRLTQNVTCSATAAPPTNADFGLSGNWYDPALSGQGLTIEVNSASNTLFFAWYTYATNGAASGVTGQRWYTGQSGYTAGARSMPVQIYETIGGVFDTPTATGPTSVAVGSGTLAFQSCSSATLVFNFTGGSSAGKSGTLTMSRVGPVPAGCVF